MGQLFGVEQGGDPILERRIDGDVGPGTGDLHRRILAEQIGQRKNQAP
jgi:hypothetical protein